MRIDAVHSESHYAAHLRPIFDALPDRLRGTFHRRQGRVESPFPHGAGVVLVAGWQDVVPLRGRNRMIYVEHGAGQAYLGDENSATQPGYSGQGGARNRGVIGYICPSDTVASRWTTAPSVGVGCPKMDGWLGARVEDSRSVCFAWHWDCGISPESRSAWSHYAPQLPDIVDHFTDQGAIVYGHAHPKWRGALNRPMTEAGMHVLETDEEVFSEASLLICDNSSLMYEFALLDRPVLTLNAPWYRRDVNHGLRFWSEIVGPMIDHPDELFGVSLHAIGKAEAHWSPFRRSVLSRVYSVIDGTSTQQAADWITELVDSL